jgi:hypothetical protein
VVDVALAMGVAYPDISTQIYITPWTGQETMSRSDFATFAARIPTDEALNRALQERFGDQSAEIPARELLDFAAEHGHTFSVEDASQELSEPELEAAAREITLAETQKLAPEPSIVLNKAGTAFVRPLPAWLSRQRK